MLSAGILLFIFFDVMSEAFGRVEGSLDAVKEGSGGWGTFAGYSTLMLGGFALGIFAIALLERAVMSRRPIPPMSGASVAVPLEAGFDASAVAEQARHAALTLGMLIATAIGIHNFSEGLAIGVSARAGETALAGTLIVGFALHNATEGFGIVGPLGNVRPSWRWLFLAGLVGGGPTFIGTMVGYRVNSTPMQVAFYALAAGAIIYVVGELWNVASRKAPKNLVLAGLTAGFVLGLATDLVLHYASTT
jgi:ZIP family zinc transporter